MAMDNPSYFNVPKGEQFPHASINPFRVVEPGDLVSSGSCSLPASPRAGDRSALRLNLTERTRRNLKDTLLPSKESFHSPTSPSSQYLVPTGGMVSSPRSEHPKRQFRSLLRSLSANAATSAEAQSILLGEPRPADIAPPHHSDPFSFKMTHNRNASLRSCAEIRATELHMLMMRRRAREREREDNFHTMPGAGGRRRHSIGAYLTKERLAGKGVLKVTSVPSEVPKMEAPRVGSEGTVVGPSCSPRRGPPTVVTTLHCSEPPLPVSTLSSSRELGTSTTHRKKKSRCHSVKEMESIIVLSCKDSPEAELWSDYLISCFNKIITQRARQHYKIFPVTIEELTESIEDNPKIKQVSNGKLQLIIMCPRLLVHVAELSEKHLHVLQNVFEADKVLTMLLGVNDESLNDIHRNAFPTYDEWERMIVIEQDNTFVDNFLGKAVDILSKKFVKPPTDKASFSIIPKKIKPGQNRVIALLNEPITSDDSITIQVDKKGEILQIHSYKKRNPYTLQFDVPDCCLEVSMLVWIKIEKNGISCGSRQIKCESRLRELDQILRASDNPLEFMCQTLGFKTTDREQLDSWMLTAFQRNIPPHFNLLASPLQGNLKVTPPTAIGVEEYPTLLHFAARFGLEKLCWQLLECPGGEAACTMRNLRHLTPADLAQHHGFPDLATILRGYMQMNEFSNMYYYLKNMSEESPEAANNLQGNHVKILNTEHSAESWAKFNSSKGNITPINTPDSNRSDPFSEECLHNLESKHSHHKVVKPLESPRTPASPKQNSGEWLYENDVCQMTSSITSQSSLQRAIEHDYLIQPSNRKVESAEPPSYNRPNAIELNLNKKPNSKVNSPTTDKGMPYKLPPEFFETKNNFTNIPLTKNKHSGSVSISSKSSHDHIATPTGQDELAEIINDFKNNVFTISEVEKLVMEWRNRNETQQSLKEKQDQLNKMREEYDKLQRRIKDDMKRPTPFERVRKIFSKGKHKNVKNGLPDVGTNGQRPNSGMSIHSVSSSSSGRLSTASGGSLGDSGTQSDNEDAKVYMEMNTLPKSPTKTTERFILEDYLIPPPPRPLTSNNFSQSQVSHFHGKNQPLPSIPTMCYSKQEYILKSPHPMDTINEKDQIETVLDTSQFPQSRYAANNEVADHHYMNMSPA